MGSISYYEKLHPLHRNPSTRVEPVLTFNDSEFLFEGQKASVDDLRAELLREGTYVQTLSSFLCSILLKCLSYFLFTSAVNSYLPKVLSPRSRGALAVVSEIDGLSDGALSALASAAVIVQEKEKTSLIVGGGGSDELNDKQRNDFQSQSSGYTSTDCANVSYGSSATSLRGSVHATVVMANGFVAPKQSTREQDQELARGNKRGRMDTPAAPPVGSGGIQKEKVGGILPLSSSSLSSDVSMMSDRMKALSTSTTAAVTDRSTTSVGSTVQPAPEGTSADNALLYVRRGAKRTSLAVGRSATGLVGAEVVIAVSDANDAAEEDEDEEGWKHNDVDDSSNIAVGAADSSLIPVAIVENERGVEKVISNSKGSSSKKMTFEKQKSASGGSLYLCLGREYSSENIDEGNTAVVEESDEADGTCNFKATARNARRTRAARRSTLITTLANQKPDPCLIL